MGIIIPMERIVKKLRNGEFISREAFKAEIRSLSTHYLNEWDTLGVLAAADRIPAADVRPVVRGKWISKYPLSTCSVCEESMILCDFANFCPNCGADMRAEEDE